MQRLLMGEVGSGKTVVALYAMLRALESGRQAALMAPTETLAEQHFRDPRRAARRREADPVRAADRVDRRAEPRGETLERLATGELGLIVGTHALIEPDVEFAGLAVASSTSSTASASRQRAALDAKGPGEAGAARPAHDRDADPADALADRLRRPRHDRRSRELPGGPAADQDLGRRRGEARGRLRLHPRAAARGPPGLRRLPAGRASRRQLAGEGGRAPRPSGSRRGELARLRGRRAARADALARQGRGDGALRRGRDRRAGRDQRDRGRDRRRRTRP